MSKIQSIYYDFIDSGEYCDTQNAKNAYKQFEKTLKETTKDDKAAFNEITDACVNYASEAELQGFVYGFKYAMKLMMEL